MHTMLFDCVQTEAGVPLLVPGLNRALYQWDGTKLEVCIALLQCLCLLSVCVYVMWNTFMYTLKYFNPHVKQSTEQQSLYYCIIATD